VLTVLRTLINRDFVRWIQSFTASDRLPLDLAAV